MQTKKCYFCKNGTSPDYKEPEQLKRYLTSVGAMKPARKSGVCSKHQRKIEQAVKRARQLALLPLSREELCDGEAE